MPKTKKEKATKEPTIKEYRLTLVLEEKENGLTFYMEDAEIPTIHVMAMMFMGFRNLMVHNPPTVVDTNDPRAIIEELMGKQPIC